MESKQRIISALGTYGIRQYYEISTGVQLGKINGSGEADPICCPFHDEKTGSFSINLFTGLWHCYGACNKGGSIFDFHIQKNGGGFKDALKYFGDMAGVEVGRNGNGTGKGKDFVSLADKFRGKWEAARMNTLVKATPYLESRDITSETIGLISGTVAGHTSRAYAGVYKGKSMYSAAIVIPMREFDFNSPDPKLVGIQNIFPDPPVTQRKNGGEERLSKRHEKGSKPEWGGTWFGSPKSGIWVITESFIDGLSVYQACRDVFVISLFAAGHGKALKNKIPAGKEIICFFDNDDAGKKATRKMAGMYPDAKTVSWEGCITKDANEILVKTIDGKEQIGMMLRNAVSVDLTAPIKGIDDSLAVADISECETLGEAVEAINEKHSMIKIGGAVRIMEEFHDPVFDRPDLEFISVHDFKTLYSNIDIDGIKIVNYWLKSRDRKQFERMIFAPGKDLHPSIYNLWKGLAVEPKKGSCDNFLSLTFNVIASENDYLFNWIMAYLADMVKNPGGDRPGTSVALMGDMGTGKSLWVKYFGSILGQHFLHVSSARRLVDRFNFHLKDAILVFCDEGFFAGDKTMAGALKAMVTEDVNLIEPKNVNPIRVKNYIRLIFATNEDWVVPAGMNERRFAVLKVADTFRQDRKFFGDLVHEMNNGGKEALLDHLLNFEPDLKIDITQIPKTDALFDQIMNSATTIEKFWFEQLIDGKDEIFDNQIKTDDLYDMYLKFAEIDGKKFKESRSKFSREIKKLCETMERRKIRDRIFTHWVNIFPSLTAARLLFEKRTCARIKWELFGTAKE
jgi:hypothetical protein